MSSEINLNIKPSKHKWQVLNATNIKLIAVVLMFFDHIHQMWAHVGAPIWLNILGRPVFPMFLFIAAESFYHTRSKKKYLKRILFASWGMTIFTFLLQRIVPNENVVLMNNAFSTFFITSLYMLFWDWFVDGVKNKKPKKIVKAILFGFIPIFSAIPFITVGILVANESISGFTTKILVMISMLIPNILTIEGGLLIVIIGVLFYIFRKYRIIQISLLILFSAIIYVLNPTGNVQWLMFLAIIPMALYNGERGIGMKNFFYIFYPAHIGFLYILSTLIGK